GGDLLAPSTGLDLGQAQVEAFGVPAAVVGREHPVEVRELVRGDEVATTDLGGIQAQFDGELVHHAFHREVSLGLPPPSVGAVGRPVGDHTANLDADVRDLVRARHHDGAKPGWAHPGAADFPAQCGAPAAAQAANPPVAISTQLHVQDRLPRMGAGGEALQSVLDVFDGAAGEPGHQTGDDLLAVEVSLGSETATERGYPHPNA